MRAKVLLVILTLQISFAAHVEASTGGRCVGKTSNENSYCVGRGYDQDHCEYGAVGQHCIWIHAGGQCVGRTSRDNSYCIGRGYDQDHCEYGAVAQHCKWIP